MKKLTTAFLFLFISIFVFGQNETRLLRFPTIHGNQIVFSYAGNLYSVSANGGTARQLTSDKGYEMFPKFSPDGKLIAFTGQYDGNTEVFVIPSEGGVPKRVTYTATLGRDDIGDRMGPNNIVMDWTPDGKNILFRSRKKSFNSFKGSLFTVSVSGGMPKQLELAFGGFSSYSPDGKKLAFNQVFREFRTWKYYRGGMADDIWIHDFATKKTVRITDTLTQEIEPMWIGNEIYFLSDRDRTMNLFVYNTTTKKSQKVTHFTDYDIKFPSASENMIVFEQAGYIWKFNPKTKKSKKLSIAIDNAFEGGRTRLKNIAKDINTMDLSPKGERVVFTAHGDIFTVPAKKGITQNLTKSSSANDMGAIWSPDGKYIAYISDKSGEFQIYMQRYDASEPAVQLTKNLKTYIFDIQWSPDSKKILWCDKKQDLSYVDISTKKITTVYHSDLKIVNDFDWSPDNKWIVFTRPEKGFDRIVLYNLTDKKIQELTTGWFTASSPVFSKDGKFLLFSSGRTFHPTYSRTEWNHSYNNMNKIYMVALSKDTKSPFAPENDDLIVDTPKKESGKTNKASISKDVKIDLAGIQDRIIELPVKAANYFNILSIKDKVYYIRYEKSGLSACVYDLKNKKETVLGKNLFYTLAASGEKMLVSSKNKYQVVALPSAKVQITKPIDVSNIKMYINYHQEWAQIYDECWRRMRDFFYDPNMHGVDWKAMHDKYAVLVPYVNHRSDLTYLLGELIGELSIGHSYSVNGEHPKPERIKTGLLGGQFSRDKSGYFKIDKLLKGANWSSGLRSPLTEIGVNAKVGDYIIAIDGVETKTVNNMFELLVDKANKTVELTINSKPSASGAHKVLIKPLADEANLYYFNWVENNIKKVSKATNGRVGYIHIPDMGSHGLNEFVKHYYSQLTKDALIIDDRGNGGGNVSPMIIERLARTMTYATMHSGEKRGDVNPVGTMIGPKVALIDQYSASDGDLFPYRFRYKKLGTIIGKRTWGGVVGYSGAIPVVDGGYIITPSYAPYAADGSGFIIEGHGVDPDIVVEDDPYQLYLGNDAQLNKAIEVILEKLKTAKTKVPSVPDFPIKNK